MKTRYKIEIRGNVQGVGFRPFIYRLASKLNLKGFVCNTSTGVTVDVEGEAEALKNFIAFIYSNKPEVSFISGLEYSELDLQGYSDFKIVESKSNDDIDIIIPPDIAVCTECLYEMYDRNNRRYLYPFINCTNCGPRYSIIESMPYDRQNTSMKIFNMCDECKKEYQEPLDRRFHAEPIACPVCGPKLQLWDSNGICLIDGNEVIDFAVELILKGYIIAIKGIGGFQLVADASNSTALKLLRIRKRRSQKPFALMFPDYYTVEEICYVSTLEKCALISKESPIVLLKRKITDNKCISEECAPENPYLGVMLPYSPLHHLLMKKFQRPIVATSGNLSEEPICIDNYEALKRLNKIADYFVVHNRPIVRHVDDSIVRIINNKQVILRRARGFAPFPISFDKLNSSKKDILALGSHLKNTIAIRKKKNIILSQHIGDLTTSETYSTFIKTVNNLSELNRLDSHALILCDSHLDYLSTKYGESLNKSIFYIQHHYAHVAACRIENEIYGDALGVSWDGAGYGLDGNIWGGEFFLMEENKVIHIGQFKIFPLPGGEIAIKEPRRSLAGILFEIFNNQMDYNELIFLHSSFSQKEFEMIKNILLKKINTPYSSSVGRLFDAFSSFLNICHINNYEGQAAMMLEFNADERIYDYYNFEIKWYEKIIIDWSNLFLEAIRDIKNGVDKTIIAAKFHNTLANIILNVAKITESEKVLLSGGCFQNKLLTERTIDLLNSNNIKTYTNQKIPPNDGGIAAGQIAAYLLTEGKILNAQNYLNKYKAFNYVSSSSR